MSDVLLMTLGIVVFVIGLAVSIALHEVGHLVPAKRFGVKVSQYMVGFGPTLWSRRRGETEYGVKAIPLGGFVRMIGMLPPEPGTDPRRLRRASTGPIQGLIEDARRASREEIGEEDVDRLFYRKAWWKKLIIMLGGPFMNVVIAVVLAFGVLTVHGVADENSPQTAPVVNVVSECVLPADSPRERECSPSDPVAPAAAAGFRAGDLITRYDGVAVSSWADVRAGIQNGGAGPVDVTVQRGTGADAEQLTLTPDILLAERPARDADGEVVEDRTEEVGFLGLAPLLPAIPQDLGGAADWIGGFAVDSVQAVARLPARMVDVWNVAFNGAERGIDTPMSIYGAGRVGGEIAALDEPVSDRIAVFVLLLAGFNMAIALFNLLPLLPLDGGHAVGAIWEGVKRGWARVARRPEPGPVDVAKALPLAYGVAAVFIGMTLLLVYVDIVAPIPLLD